jgi:putative transposase
MPVIGRNDGQSFPKGEANWSEVFRGIKDRGLSGVKLAVSDAHQGIRRALARHFQGVAWQRCRVNFKRG